MSPFDRDYYRRFYFDPRTAVGSPAEARARARLMAALAEHIGLPVRRILDAGCGIGQLRAALLESLPRATYVGLEVSEYLCRRYGWEQGGIEDYRSAGAFDLTICYDVLQYLEDRRAARAIANLTRLTRGVLYFSALTRLDWRENCDRRRTDPHVHMRPAEWYRARLRRGFREIGAGFWVRKGAPLVIWELERASVSGALGRAPRNARV
ncbi:MAG: class I SAM-dependent methyltransferase [Steroidobacteraceae bacterium]